MCHVLRLATFNVNGIRAASRRGFDLWLKDRDCDVVCLQEVRCPTEVLPLEAFGDYELSYHSGNLPGRNGVAVLSRQPPLAVRSGFGSRVFDAEGRYVEVDLPANGGQPPLTIGSLYLPKGDAPSRPGGETRYQRKLLFLSSFARYLTRARRTARAAGREFVVMGDFNIAHAAADLKNWRTNQRSCGFLPAERDWMGSILSPRTLVDVVRALHPGEAGPYTWWSWRGNSFTNDVGWRIDYQLATPDLAAAAITGGTDRDASHTERISDHAPVVVEYDI